MSVKPTRRIWTSGPMARRQGGPSPKGNPAKPLTSLFPTLASPAPHRRKLTNEKKEELFLDLDYCFDAVSPHIASVSSLGADKSRVDPGFACDSSSSSFTTGAENRFSPLGTSDPAAEVGGSCCRATRSQQPGRT